MSVPSTASIADSRLATTSAVSKVAELVGRIMLAVLFLVSGFGKLMAYGATTAYIASLGVPGVLLPLVIATELLGGIAIVIGWKTRIVAFLLAGFTLLTGLVFHSNFADQNQAIHFMKNVSIAGAFMLLVCNGAGPLSLDHRRRK
jgi:putative oxidoreductase